MRKFTLIKSDLPDWYTIEHEEHDHTSWFDETFIENGEGKRVPYYSFRHSGRITKCDIEGSSAEMREIMEAIKSGKGASFKRCEAEPIRNNGGVLIGFNVCSPRNDYEAEFITLDEANYLAKNMERVLAED